MFLSLGSEVMLLLLLVVDDVVSRMKSQSEIDFGGVGRKDGPTKITQKFNYPTPPYILLMIQSD